MDNGAEWDPEFLQKRQKAVRSTTKALNALCANIGEALGRSAWQGQVLDDVVGMTRARKMEAEERLATQVAKVRELVTYYYQQQQDVLTNSLKQFLELVMVCKMEALNHEARLAELERQTQEKLHVISEQDDVTKADRKDVNALLKEFKACVAPSLAPEMLESVTYTLEAPDVIADSVQMLVGRLVTSSDPMTTSFLSGRAGSPGNMTPEGGSENDRRGQGGHKTPAPSKKTKEKKKKAKKEPTDTKTPTTANGRLATNTFSSQQNIAQSSPSKAPDQSEPRVVIGRGKVVSGLAARADGRVWVVYGSSDPHLDLLDRSGSIMLSATIPGGNAKHVACYGPDDALVVSLSPRVMTLFRNGSGEDSEIIKALNYKCTGVAVGRSGIAISSSCTIYWTSRHSGSSQWIVRKNDSCLKSVSALAVLEARGKVFVCAADKGEQVVHVYRRSLRGRFVPLDPYRPADIKLFCPVSLSPHYAGFVAVLDSPTRRVYIAEVGTQQVTSFTTIDGFRLCDGVPSVVAFAPADEEVTGRPALWVATTTGHMCLTRLNFDFNLL